MVTGYSNYIVEIRQEKFISHDGRIFDRVAVVKLLDGNGDEIGEELFGAADMEDVYGNIRGGRPVSLDNCYVRDFSLPAFRKLEGKERKDIIAIKGFSARNAFFEAQTATDFSYASFGDGDLSFEGSHFVRGKVLFTGSLFGTGCFNFSNTVFRNGNIEFTGAVFGDGDFLFRNAIVNDGIKDFQDIQFGTGEVSFANTEFGSGELLFINTRFGDGRVSFKVARIAGGKVDFHYSVFGDCDVIFERTEFGNSRVDFRTVDFGRGRVNFNRSVFGDGDLNFEGVAGKVSRMQFKRSEMGTGSKNFSLMELGDTDLSFGRTNFGDGDVSFYESKVFSLSLQSCHLDHYFDLRLAQARVLDISDTIVRDIVDIEPYGFPVDIKILDMSGMRLLGKIYIDWRQNGCERTIMDQKLTTLEQKAEQFRILKENFSNTGKYEDEDKAYIMFKRYEAISWLSEQKERGGIRKPLSYIPHAFQWLVFDKIGLYATSPGRVLFSVLVFWLVFGAIYFLIELSGLGQTASSVANPDHLTVIIKSFYHSAITFFTIGYGDIYPVGLSRLISGIEGFMGVFMMSYFTVAFVRKILR